MRSDLEAHVVELVCSCAQADLDIAQTLMIGYYDHKGYTEILVKAGKTYPATQRRNVVNRKCSVICAKTKLAKEIPRLCRGGSKSLTSPAVAPQAPIDETSSVSRQAHDQSSIDGRPM